MDRLRRRIINTNFFVFRQESGDDEYHGEHSDTEDEVDSDFDIDEGDEPDSDQEEDAPRRKSRVVTKAYKVELKKEALFYYFAKNSLK